MSIQIARQANNKVARHGLNVYPLEAFGLLVGTGSPTLVHTVLPVGKTMHWYATSDRFLGLNQAAIVAAGMLAQRNLEVIGVYHTFAGGHSDFEGSDVNPICQVPAELRDCIVLVRPLHGGESFYMSSIYTFNREEGWAEVESKLISYHEADPRLNPKRIHRDWLAVWGQIDYGNNWQTERMRIFGD